MTQTLPSVDLNPETGTDRAVAERGASVDSVEGSVDDRQAFRLDAGPAETGVLRQRTLDASIVVPYYNPGDRLRTTVENLVRELGATGMSFEIITVSDGSTDGSPSTLARVARRSGPKRLLRRRMWERAMPLRRAFALGRGRYLGFIDADGDIPPEFLASFISVMHADESGHRSSEANGIRIHRCSQSPLRRFYSLMHQNLNRLLFRLNVRDTQVGIKWWTVGCSMTYSPLLRENRFAFDIELLVLARRLGYTQIVEAPVHIRSAWAARSRSNQPGAFWPTPWYLRSRCPFSAITTPLSRPGWGRLPRNRARPWSRPWDCRRRGTDPRLSHAKNRSNDRSTAARVENNSQCDGDWMPVGVRTWAFGALRGHSWLVIGVPFFCEEDGWHDLPRDGDPPVRSGSAFSSAVASLGEPVRVLLLAESPG